MITKELKGSLACIHCRGDIYLDNNIFHCVQCSATYKIKNGIPIFFSNTKDSELSLFDKNRFERWEGNGSIKSCEQYAKQYPYKEFEDPILNICKGKVLEIGCGSGRFLTRLQDSEEVDRIVGLDPSETMLIKSSEKGFNVVQGIGEKLPFKNNYFDTVVSVLYTIQYTNRELTYSEVYRVLKPGGYFAFDLLNYYQVMVQEIWYTMRTHKIWNWVKNIKKKSSEQFWHLNVKNINNELKLLKTAGFDTPQIMTTRFIPFLRKYSGNLGFWKGRFSTFLGHNIIIVCRKDL